MQRRVAVAVSAIALVGALLCLHDLGSRPLWFDEGWSLGCARLSGSDSFHLAVTEPVQWPYYLVLRAWLLLGDSEAMIRMPSALFMIASIPMMFLASRRLFGTAAGLTSAALLATNAGIIKYAHEARSYGMEIFLLITSVYILCRFLDQPTRNWQLIYITVCVVAIYTHIYGTLAIAAQALSLSVLPSARVRRKTWLITYSAIGILAAPMWLFAVKLPRVYTDWMPMPSWPVVYTALKHICGNAGPLPVFIFGLVFALTVICAFVILQREGQCEKSWALVLAFSCFSLPFFLPIAASYLGRPCFMSRYALLSVPGLVLMAGALVSLLRKPVIAFPVTMLLIALGVVGAKSYYRTDYDRMSEPYRELAVFIAQHAAAGDAIALYWPGMHVPYDYYLNRLPATFPKPTVICPARPGGIEALQLVSSNPDWPAYLPPVSAIPDHARVWLVANRLAINAKDPLLLRFFAAISRDYPLVESWEFPAWSVFLCSKPKPAAP